MKVHREFYLEFSQDPHTFITRWLASQSHDLQQMTDATPGHPEQERHADFYDASWVYEAVKRYLYNRVCLLSTLNSFLLSLFPAPCFVSPLLV